ncbi:MAG TPA: MauE/DoxX family redox-associated membrane protein [Armatimonadota bacterium]|nr:MauE/DoxX family redox-associated membrane protein [Armatimonadota bacterium]
MSVDKSSAVAWLAQSVLSATFATASVAKIAEFDQLVRAIRVSGLVPDALCPAAAALVIAAEILVAIGVWIPRWRSKSLWISSALCWVFLWYNAWRWCQHIVVPCTCFGAIFQVPPAAMLAADMVLLAASAGLLWQCRRTSDPYHSGGPSWTDRFVSTAAVRDEWSVWSGAAVIGAICLVVAALHPARSGRGAQSEPDPQPLRVPAAEIISHSADFRGDPHAPYTLVEFGDYQCGPCRAANPEVSTLLARYPGRLRFAFRNLPLVNIHPLALPAAIAAEMARARGQFWTVHDRLYSSPLDRAALDHLQRSLGPDSLLRAAAVRAARRRVESDEREASSLHLYFTPSFVVCDPAGRAVLLSGLNQLPGVLGRGPARASDSAAGPTTPLLGIAGSGGRSGEYGR